MDSSFSRPARRTRRAGTHATVTHEVAEDLALAQAFLRTGRKLHFAFAERLMETRMYQNLSHLIEGWSKNIYLGRPPLVPARAPPASVGSAHASWPCSIWLLPPAVLLASAVDPASHELAPAALLATPSQPHSGC